MISQHQTTTDESVASDTHAGLLDRLQQLEQQVASLSNPDGMNLVVFDGSRDRLLAAFSIATGAAACGMEVSMFFTFWGTTALKKTAPQTGKKSLVERAFGWMLPSGVRQTRLSQMDMAGVGRMLMAREMKNKNIADLTTLLDSAADLGVKISVCEMSMKIMGIRREEIIDYPQLDYCGVASFIEGCGNSNTSLFI